MSPRSSPNSCARRLSSKHKLIRINFAALFILRLWLVGGMSPSVGNASPYPRNVSPRASEARAVFAFVGVKSCARLRYSAGPLFLADGRVPFRMLLLLAWCGIDMQNCARGNAIGMKIAARKSIYNIAVASINYGVACAHRPCRRIAGKIISSLMSSNHREEVGAPARGKAGRPVGGGRNEHGESNVTVLLFIFGSSLSRHKNNSKKHF